MRGRYHGKLALPSPLPSPPHLSHRADQVALAWFALDATTHLTIELIFLVFATLVPGGAEKSDSPLAFIWKEVRGCRGRGWRGNEGGGAERAGCSPLAGTAVARWPSHTSLPPPPLSCAQYGKADARWMKPWEPGTVSVEVPTVFVAGLGAIVILYGIIKNT